MLRLSVLATLLLLSPLANGCSESSDNAGGAGGSGGSGGQSAGSAGVASDASSECPLVAVRCPAGCSGIDAWILEPSRACLSRQVRIGCVPEGQTGTGDVACLKEVSTTGLLQVSSGTLATALAATDTYDECSAEETATAMAAEACTLAGGDAGPCPSITTTCPAGCVPFEGKQLDRMAECFLPGTQLGCYPEADTVTRNGACVQEIATSNVYFLESGSYANQLQIEGSYQACGLDDVAATSGVTDCP